MSSMDTLRGDMPTQVRQERRRRKMTQRQVAEQAGVSLRAYQNFESGESVPQQKNLESILRVLPVDATQLDLTGAREATVGSWPADVQVFIDMMETYVDLAGAFLATLDEAERHAYISNVTAYIHAQTRGMVARRTRTD